MAHMNGQIGYFISKSSPKAVCCIVQNDECNKKRKQKGFIACKTKGGNDGKNEKNRHACQRHDTDRIFETVSDNGVQAHCGGLRNGADGSQRTDLGRGTSVMQKKPLPKRSAHK